MKVANNVSHCYKVRVQANDAIVSQAILANEA
jgi:hypothetical protein